MWTIFVAKEDLRNDGVATVDIYQSQDVYVNFWSTVPKAEYSSKTSLPCIVFIVRWSRILRQLNHKLFGIVTFASEMDREDPPLISNPPWL